MAVPRELRGELTGIASALGYTLAQLTPRLYEDTVLAQNGGWGALPIYDDLLRDARVFGAWKKRVKGVTSKDWEVLPAGGAETFDATDQLAADIVTAQLQGLRYDDISRRELKAIVGGLSVGELIWDDPRSERERRNKGNLILRDVRFRRPWWFRFGPENELRFINRFNYNEGTDLRQFPRKFVTYSWGSNYDDPYGLGMGHQLYWPVTIKRQGWRFWCIFAEKWAAPTVEVEIPEGKKATDPEVMDALDAARAFALETVVGRPKGFVFNLLETSRSGDGAKTYAELVQYCDKEIAIAVLGSTLTLENYGSGSRAATQEHGDDLDELSSDDADHLTEHQSESWVEHISYLNVPDATPPLVRRIFPDTTDYGTKAKTEKTVVEAVANGLGLDYAQRVYGVEIDVERLGRGNAGAPDEDEEEDENGEGTASAATANESDDLAEEDEAEPDDA